MPVRRLRRFPLVAVLVLVAAGPALPVDAGVPPVIRFTGSLPAAQGPTAIVFSLYAWQDGGLPLWTETQNVIVEPDGRYSVVLGATSAAGLPVELFAAGEARWIGVAPEGGAERPRVMMVSVPYALKAADAETVGGKPLSSFVLAGDTTGVGADGLTYVDRRVLANALSGTPPSGGAGTRNFLALFTDATNLGNSVMSQGGPFSNPTGITTYIGVNNQMPEAQFHVAASSVPGVFVDVYSDSLGALPVVYRAARGTPGGPTAVMAGDILGGLAVRGHMGGANGFSTGRGQVMFKAAENWSGSATGTYLVFATAPTGISAGATERMRIDASGKVGIGAAAPAFPLDVRAARGATHVRVGPDNGFPLFLIASYPVIGFNAYYESGYRYGAAGKAGFLGFDPAMGSFTVGTAPSGSAESPATMTARMVVTNDGRVGIGTSTPVQALDVAGSVRVTGEIRSGAGSVSVPLAHGTVDGTGLTFGLVTPNVASVTRTAAGTYRIAILNETLSLFNHLCLATVFGAAGLIDCTLSSSQSDLVVHTYGVGGGAEDRSFNFVLFKR